MDDNSTLRSLIEEFASLQAAQRALAHAVHPSALAPVKEHSRALLIQLQALSSEVSSPVGDASGIGSSIETLEQIRRGLTEQAARTRVVLEGIGLSQLRASIPLLVQQHPEEVCGLVDVLLSGSLEGDKSLRTLEYLITMLSTAENGGRRAVVREPGHVTPRLLEVARQRLKGDDSQCAAAERFMEDATLEILKEGELGEIRDRVRAFKQELGPDVLQPRILAAAVAYNVAMWNRVAAEIDSSRSLEQLTAGLLAPDSSATSVQEPVAALEVLDTETFRRLVAALATRVAGGESSDLIAREAAESLPLESIRGEDADLFEADESDEAIWLMRAAVTVGLVLQHRPAMENVLGVLGIDVELLANQGVDELLAHMSELARKRFAASDYTEAFRLSDVKTHSLVTHAAARRASDAVMGSAIESDESLDDGSAQSSSWMNWLKSSLFSGPALMAVFVLMAGYLFFPMNSQEDAASERAALTKVSPFLVHGQHSLDTNPPRFLGTLGGTWNYLGTKERHEVASEIGEHFANLGTESVTLTDLRSQVVASYKNGKVIILVPRAEGEDDAEY